MINCYTITAELTEKLDRAEVEELIDDLLPFGQYCVGANSKKPTFLIYDDTRCQDSLYSGGIKIYCEVYSTLDNDIIIDISAILGRHRVQVKEIQRKWR